MNERLEHLEAELATIGKRFDAVKALCATVDNAAQLRDSYSEGWRDALNRVDDLLDGAA